MADPVDPDSPEKVPGLFPAEAFSDAAESNMNLMSASSDSTEKVNGLALALKNLADIQIAGFRSANDLAKASSDVHEASKKAVDGISKVSEGIIAFEYVSRQIIGQVANVTAGGNALTSTLNALSSTLLSFKSTQPFGYMVGGLKSLVDIYDSTVKAQREVIFSQLQAGLSYKDHSGIIDDNRRKMETAAAAWGMLGEEAAKTYSQFSGAGIGARPGETGAARARSVGNDLTGAFEAAISASKAYGLSMDLTTRLTTQFGTVFDARGKEFSMMMGQMTEQGNKSVLGQSRYLDTVSSVVDATKVYAPSLLKISLLTEMFGSAVKEGTISLDTIAKLSSPAKLGFHGLAVLALAAKGLEETFDGISARSMTDFQVMDKIALSRADLDKALKGGTVAQKELVQSLSLINRAVNYHLPEFAAAPLSMKQKMLEGIFGWHMEVVEVAKVFGGDIEISAKKILKAGEDIAKNDPAKLLAAAATAAFKPFQTSEQKFAFAVKDFREAVDKFKGDYETVTEQFKSYRAEGSGVVESYLKVGLDAAKGFVTDQLGAPGYIPKKPTQPTGMAIGIAPAGQEIDLGIQATTRGASSFDAPSGATRGASGLNINLGGITVKANDRKEMEKEIREGLDKVGTEAIKMINNQQKRSTLAK